MVEAEFFVTNLSQNLLGTFLLSSERDVEDPKLRFTKQVNSGGLVLNGKIAVIMWILSVR